jgi:hypothetical protein
MQWSVDTEYNIGPPLEVHWMLLPATEKIRFDHDFEPAKDADRITVTAWHQIRVSKWAKSS